MRGGPGVGDGGAGPAEATGGPSEVLDLGGFLIERLDHSDALDVLVDDRGHLGLARRDHPLQREHAVP